VMLAVSVLLSYSFCLRVDEVVRGDEL
jgi:hypothetical protein